MWVTVFNKRVQSKATSSPDSSASELTQLSCGVRQIASTYSKMEASDMHKVFLYWTTLFGILKIKTDLEFNSVM